MAEFSMEDVKELVFTTTMNAYSERKQLVTYIAQLEARVKELVDKYEPATKE